MVEYMTEEEIIAAVNRADNEAKTSTLVNVAGVAGLLFGFYVAGEALEQADVEVGILGTAATYIACGLVGEVSAETIAAAAASWLYD